MIALPQETFDGWAIRYAWRNFEYSPEVCDSILLTSDLRGCREFIAQSTAGGDYLRYIDAYPFFRLDKRSAQLVYHRFVPVVEGSEHFVASYLGAEETAYPAVGPEVPVIPARGKLEERIRDLAARRRADREFALFRGADPDTDPTEGDPWYDVAYAYEFYSGRALTRVEGGFHDSVWFFGAGMTTDVDQVLADAVQQHVEELGGDLVAIRGPKPANTFPQPGLALPIASGVHGGAGDRAALLDFEARVVTLEAWQDPS